jgi:hypothetical protein
MLISRGDEHMSTPCIKKGYGEMRVRCTTRHAHMLCTFPKVIVEDEKANTCFLTYLLPSSGLVVKVVGGLFVGRLFDFLVMKNVSSFSFVCWEAF